jgi:Domain of unknown function (DUF1844)
MAEYQNTTVSSGEMTQRFIEFVMMQAQNAAFMLGQIPHPQTGKADVNLEMAQLLIDQLAMIQEKTKGNLNSDESRILAGTLSNLQMLFVEAAEKRPSAAAQTRPSESRPIETPAEESKAESHKVEQASPEQSDADGKKKFVKSYGS